MEGWRKRRVRKTTATLSSKAQPLLWLALCEWRKRLTRKPTTTATEFPAQPTTTTTTRR